MDRRTRALQHSKDISTGIKEGSPTRDSFPADGVPQVWYISGRGLYLVTRYKSKLYYIQFSENI